VVGGRDKEKKETEGEMFLLPELLGRAWLCLFHHRIVTQIIFAIYGQVTHFGICNFQ